MNCLPSVPAPRRPSAQFLLIQQGRMPLEKCEIILLRPSRQASNRQARYTDSAELLGSQSHVRKTNRSKIGHRAPRRRSRFDCKLAYQDETWALVEFANISLAFVLSEQHPPHFAVLGDPNAFGEPKTHRDGARSVYLKDPSGNDVEILALK